MRRFLTLVCLLCLALPAGISIVGCSRDPGANYCNGLGYGLKIGDVFSITLPPQTTGLSLAFGQTQQASSPSAKTCKGDGASPTAYAWGTTNNQLVDISPTGNICAGTWNRNSGGGIANYTTCSAPKPLPSSGGLPYGVAYITASASSVTSNPVAVYVHPQVTSVSLVGPTQQSGTPVSGIPACLSQGTLAPVPLDVQACYAGGNNQQVLLCAPDSVTKSAHPSLACNLPTVTVNGVPQQVPLASIPSCNASIGTLSYTMGNSAVGTINPETNQITANQSGTSTITATIAQSGSSAGYFSTCPPASISVTLNGKNSGVVTAGVKQTLVTTVVDTLGKPITGLSLDYQSTDPLDISVDAGGNISTTYPSQAAIFAICQPPNCNSAPSNLIGLNGTGLSIASSPVNVTAPGTASDYLWFSAPGQSQYFASISLLAGTIGSPSRLPYVPNSMVMDTQGNNLYFGSSRELMVVSTSGNSVIKQDTTVPGTVLAVSPDNTQVLINDPVRQVFYIYNTGSGVSLNFGGLGAAAAWTPDSRTLYIVDSAALGGAHTNTMYAYSQFTGWTSYDLSGSTSTGGSTNLAITVPSVGAYLSGSNTVARTWCPTGTAGDTNGMIFYPPSGDFFPVQTDVLAATVDGKHILGAALAGGGVTLTDIGLSIKTEECTLSTALSTNGTLLTSTPLSVNAIATKVNQVVASPTSNLAFITYTGTTTGATLPYYLPTTGTAGTLNYLKLANSSQITAPVAGVFTPDNKYFFVSTSGDNAIHTITIPANGGAPTDTQQVNPSLPVCTPLSASDPDCKNLLVPAGGIAPATVITVKPRATT